MGAMEKIFILLCTVVTVRAHIHGIKLIVVLALAYLLQKGNKNGNKKPKSLFRRSTDSLSLTSDENPLLHPASTILQRALELDELECAQRAVCRLSMRETSGQWWNDKERSLLQGIVRTRAPKSKGDEAFQAAAEYGKNAGTNEKACSQRYNKCPHSDTYVDSILAGIG